MGQSFGGTPRSRFRSPGSSAKRRPGRARSVTMRLTKIYTRTGDAGKTRLAGGQEVWKDSLRVEAYGTVDELNAVLGLARVFNADAPGDTRVSATLDEHLRWIQNKLFDAGSLLATAPGQVFRNMPSINSGDVARLEHLIDLCQEELSALK